MKMPWSGLNGAALLGISLFAVPAFAQEAAPAPAPKPVTIPAVEVQPALWVVKDADTTIYLFGTFHVLRPGIDWFKGPVKSAFRKADKLVLEVDVSDEKALGEAISARATDPDGPPLSQKLTPEDRAEYAAEMEKLGLPLAAFEPLKPWVVGMTLGVLPLAKAGYDANSGAERTLIAAAKASGKPIGEIEGVEQQITILDSMPEEEQIAFLNATVEEAEDVTSETDKMVEQWARGDVETLAREMNEEMADQPALADRLLYQRNARWAKWLAQQLQTPGTLFVAVGAGHLAGPRSVQDQLKDMKIKSVRISYD